MKTERSDIEFPVWRKKVDASIFKDAATPIPKWLWGVWQIEPLFCNCTSKANTESSVKVLFENKEYSGRVNKSNGKEMYRLSFSKELCDELKDTFLMSYMRTIEQGLRKAKASGSGQENAKVSGVSQEIEKEIPFWEFLDIEFDAESKKFYFKAYYKQKPLFSELFKELARSHTLKIIDDIINDNQEFRITKQDWLPREKLKKQIDAKNVIYNLIDTQNEIIYIGEAESLVTRLNQARESIKDWDYYRYDCLPAGLSKYQRVAIERLIIRTFASFFRNKRGIITKDVSSYCLGNDRIDT